MHDCSNNNVNICILLHLVLVHMKSVTIKRCACTYQKVHMKVIHISKGVHESYTHAHYYCTFSFG